MQEHIPGTLDRRRSFGTVYGHPGIGFYQDNKPFKHDGNPYFEELSKAAAPVLTAPKPEDLPTAEQVAERPLSHSEKMKQVWAARRAAENATP